MKSELACMAGLVLLTACGEPDVVVVEPIEEEGVDRKVVSGDGIEAREDVDAVVMPDANADDTTVETRTESSEQ